MIRYNEKLPSHPAPSLIDRLWEMKSDDDSAGQTEAIIPDGHPEIVFNLNEPFSSVDKSGVSKQPATIVVGQMQYVTEVLPTSEIHLFGVRLKPHALAVLTKHSAGDLTDSILSIRDVFGQRGVIIDERIREASSFCERVAIIETALDFGFSKTPPPWLSSAVSDITSGAFNIRIADIAFQKGVSEKTFQRGFREWIGLSPKRYSRVLRVQKVVNAVDNDADASLTEIAYSLGYFDQSHFIHDFRSIVGVSPTEFFRSQGEITGALSR